MSWFRAPLRALLLLALFLAGSMGLEADSIPGLSGKNRSFVVMLIEDHAGMREIVCDEAFTDFQFSGTFLKDHRYAIVTSGSPGLVDLGCWDQAWPNGKGWKAGAPVASVQWTSDKTGFLLSSGGQQTWLPHTADYGGKGAPMATFRGAYLNWLLANRGATPSIPKETRWQRLQRGAEAVVRDLLTRSGDHEEGDEGDEGDGDEDEGGGQPEYRIVGLGTSGRLLIPPGEGLEAGLNAVSHMEPSDSGSMKVLMDQALETIRSLKGKGNCSSGIVLPVGDGFTLNTVCGGGLAYESSSAAVAMAAMVSAAQGILATGQAEVWTWSLDGARTWAKDLAEAGRGQRFSGDAVVALDAAVKAWMARNDQPLQLALGFDQPALTRVPNVILTLTASHLLASATLNDQPLTTTGRETLIPLTLVEGLNTFTVVAADACGVQAQATAAITLDTIPPKVTLNPVPPGTTQSPSFLLTGSVDDPAAKLTLNGTALALTPEGSFSVSVNLSIGANTFAFEATDLAGNKGGLSITIRREYPPLILSVAEPLEGATVLGDSVAVSGTLSEEGAFLQVNGVPLFVSGTSFAGQVAVAKGENILAFIAGTPDGRTAMVTRTVKKPIGGGGVGGVPIVTITTPMDGFGTNLHTLTVQGLVDDPEATLMLYGKSVPLDAVGKFETTIASDKEGIVKIAAEATNAYGKGEAAVYAHFDWTVPVLTWIAPTPAEGARLTVGQITAAVGVNEPVLASINGQSAPLEPSDDPQSSTPYSVQTELALQEGHLLLRADAVDRAGNRASITRTLDIGLTAPQITFDAPAFDGGGSFRTTQAGLTVTGSVTAPDAVKPLTFTINGAAVALDVQGHFTWPANLAAGPNPIAAVATNAFGQSSTEARSIVRVQDMDDAGRPKIQIDAPLEDFSTGDAAILVRGRVNQSGLTVQLQGAAVVVDPATLKFEGPVALKAGPNVILATATDAAGITVTAVVHGLRVISGTSTYRWDLPTNGTRTGIRAVSITGRADLPGIASVSVNGVPMQLSGSGADGQITGEVQLVDKGINALLMEVTTLAGEHFSERRDVIFEPIMPRIRLEAPALAKPGDTVQLKVTPETGTTLAGTDLSWNGRLLQHLTAPFDAVPALVPSDAVAGTRIPVEAIGVDTNGETVTARTYVEVRPGGGALLVGAFDDRTGMFLTGGKATLEGGEEKLLDDQGRASFASSQPANWIRVDKANCTSVWRSAALQVAAASAVADARLTPLDPGQSAGGADFDGVFASNDFKLHVPSANLSGTGSLSLTPLSTQGLPAMLPSGWSPVSAAWLHLEGLSLSGPGSLNLTLPAAAPTQDLSWVHWDEAQHLWIVLATGLAKDQLTNLSLPKTGGYALLTADPDPIAPPASVLNQPLLGSSVPAWRDGLKATGAVDPSVMPTVDAIRGLRASAQLSLGFDGGTPVPSGALLQVDLTESYVLLDQNLIEPELRSSDAVACRFVLGVDANSKPTLRAATDGLALELPVRMSRTFGETELVEGLLRAGFYHDGLQVAIAGDLIGAAGGTTTHDGITLTFDPGALASSTFVRVLADAPADIPTLWPELVGKGRVAASFQVDIAGTVQKGLKVSIADLGSVPGGIAPLLVARRILHGQRLTLAVGALTNVAGAWTLSIPPEGNALMEGGAFAVLIPNAPWAWVSGTATMPAGTARILAQKVGLQALAGRNSMSSSASPSSRLKTQKTISRDKRDAGDKEQEKSQLQSSTAGPDVAIVDAVVTGNFIQAASGPEGRFLLPATLVTGKLSISGERYDLGVKGSTEVDVPSSSTMLRLASVPFRVMTILPAENAEVNLGQVFTVLLSAPADPATLDKVKLLSGTADISVRRSLSQDGRMLLVTPNAPLSTGTTYALVADGLTGLAGEVAPKTTRTVHTSATPPPPNEAVDFSRIKLGYPDGSFNVIITIPEGAVPALASLSLEAPLMGSAYSGQMSPSGDLVIPFKANLGERLNITVQFPSGRKVVGNLSRYEAGDGRVTLGVDGGRIDASDDSGAAVVIPAGALEEPAELRLAFTQELPVELDPTLAAYKDKVPGRIQLVADHEVAFKLRPRIEIPAPANASTAQHSDGLGAYAVFDRVEGFEEDGTPAVYFEMGDTASSDGTRLMSQGGLPEPMTMPDGTARAMLRGTAPAMRLNREMGQGRSHWLKTTNPGSVALAKEPMAQSRTIVVQPFVGMLGYMLMEAFLIDSGPHYVSGQVMVRVGAEAEKPAVGAYIYFAKDGAIKRTGQMLQLTSNSGYYILASFLTDELVRGGGQIMAIDKDWGVRSFSGTGWSGPGGIYGSYYHAPTIHLEVTPADQGDHVAPYVAARFGVPNPQTGHMEPRQMARTDEKVSLLLDVRDNRSHNAVDLSVDIKVDGKEFPGCTGQCTQHLPWAGQTAELVEWTTSTAGLITFTLRLKNLSEGRHMVQISVWDQACNRRDVNTELLVADFPVCPGASTTNHPTVRLDVGGDTANVQPNAIIKVVFDQLMDGGGMNTLKLERQDAGSWVSVPIQVYGPDGREPSFGTRLCQAVLRPSGLQAGATYRVSWSTAIYNVLSLDLVPGSAQFTVVSWSRGSAGVIPDRVVMQMASIGNRVFVAVRKPDYHFAIQEWDFSSDTWAQLGTEFGPGLGGTDFYAQTIDSMRVFEAVPTGDGGAENLLLITTTPPSWEDNRQGVLWAYSVCAAGAPQLRFAVSIGPGASGYVPTLDQANGLVSMARLSSSVLIVSVEKAMSIWNTVDPRTGQMPTPFDVKEPGGAGQQAIIQPFYLANPMTAPDAAISIAPGTQWSAVMLPSLIADGTGASVDVAVGYTQAGTNSSGDALTGVPVWRKLYMGDTWVPESPYVGPATPYGTASDRALKGPAEVTRGGTRLGVVSGLTVKVGTDDPYPTNLVLALQLGGIAGTVGVNHVVIIDEKDPANPKLRANWPTTDILGTGVAFEVLRKQPIVDPRTKLVAVPVRKIGGTPGADATWFVLDLSTPETPAIVAVVPGMGWSGSFYDKKLTLATGGGMVSVDLGGAMGQMAEKLEKENPVRAKQYRAMSITHTPFLATCMAPSNGVDFEADKDQSYGFDDYDKDGSVKHLSIHFQGTTLVKVINPLKASLSFTSDFPGKVTLIPSSTTDRSIKLQVKSNFLPSDSLNKIIHALITVSDQSSGAILGTLHLDVYDSKQILTKVFAIRDPASGNTSYPVSWIDYSNMQTWINTTYKQIVTNTLIANSGSIVFSDASYDINKNGMLDLDAAGRGTAQGAEFQVLLNFVLAQNLPTGVRPMIFLRKIQVYATTSQAISAGGTHILLDPKYSKLAQAYFRPGTSWTFGDGASEEIIKVKSIIGTDIEVFDSLHLHPLGEKIYIGVGGAENLGWPFTLITFADEFDTIRKVDQYASIAAHELGHKFMDYYDIALPIRFNGILRASSLSELIPVRWTFNMMSDRPARYLLDGRIISSYGRQIRHKIQVPLIPGDTPSSQWEFTR